MKGGEEVPNPHPSYGPCLTMHRRERNIISTKSYQNAQLICGRTNVVINIKLTCQLRLLITAGEDGRVWVPYLGNLKGEMEGLTSFPSRTPLHPPHPLWWIITISTSYERKWTILTGNRPLGKKIIKNAGCFFFDPWVLNKAQKCVSQREIS